MEKDEKKPKPKKRGPVDTSSPDKQTHSHGQQLFLLALSVVSDQPTLAVRNIPWHLLPPCHVPGLLFRVPWGQHDAPPEEQLGFSTILNSFALFIFWSSLLSKYAKCCGGNSQGSTVLLFKLSSIWKGRRHIPPGFEENRGKRTSCHNQQISDHRSKALQPRFDPSRYLRLQSW